MPLKYSSWFRHAIRSLCFVRKVHPVFNVFWLRTPRERRKFLLSVISPMLIEVQRRSKLPNTEKANIQMLQTQPWAKHSPKSVQLHSCGWEPSAGPAEKRMCLVKAWFPDGQIAAVPWPSGMKYGQKKTCTGCPWVSSMPIWDFPATHAVYWGSGPAQASLVLWRVAVCPSVFIESLGKITLERTQQLYKPWELFQHTFLKYSVDALIYYAKL